MTLITDTVNRSADTEAPLLVTLAERWSPRGYDANAVIDDSTLTTVLEAARWAPSAANMQPARFIVTRRGSAGFTTIHDSLTGFNKAWADSASVLIANVADATMKPDQDNPWASYDLGQAVAHLSIQAQHEGIHTHQMGGFDAAALATAFGLGGKQVVVSVIALGMLADVATLSPEVLERESTPRTRKPLGELLLAND
ncbi:nitroreductase family protein [Glaciibacter psychrotolerans]|uniref:Nitroreductase n=1 Tax=Glaciibacter psychrotolerans TaxID=670054 RepID=A0A7Z0EGQ1_9MICO|nr:nitroreductase family protein [Leifsonia psychrotolerans]NYJ21196.1 nitroreductase [Leifsonia psychrotolerans]